MAVLSTDARSEWREARQLTVAGLAWLLYASGWLAAKGLRLVGTLIGGFLFGLGWFAAAVVWPALCWCVRAARLGWEQGRRPIGRQT